MKLLFDQNLTPRLPHLLAGLYPNSARAISEALGRGFDNAVVLDPDGNVAEFATSNLFYVKDGIALAQQYHLPRPIIDSIAQHRDCLRHPRRCTGEPAQPNQHRALDRRRRDLAHLGGLARSAGTATSGQLGD